MNILAISADDILSWIILLSILK